MGDNKSIGNITDSQFGDNTLLQSDNNVQIDIKDYPEFESAMRDLQTEITGIIEQDKKAQAELFYGTLQEAVKQNDKSKIKTCLTFLKDAVSASASIMSIAAQLGVTIM